MSRREELLGRRHQAVRRARLPRHADGRRRRRGRSEQGDGVPLLRQQVADPLRHLQGRRRLHGGRAARRPVGVGPRDDLPLHPRLLVGIAERPRAARRCTSRRGPTSPSGSPRSRSPTSAKRRPRSTSTCATSSTAAIASGEFYDCDSHVLALGYIGMTLGSYRWLRPQGRRTAPEIAVEFSTALLRGLIRDEAVRTDSPLGLDRRGGRAVMPMVSKTVEVEASAETIMAIVADFEVVPRVERGDQGLLGAGPLRRRAAQPAAARRRRSRDSRARSSRRSTTRAPTRSTRCCSRATTSTSRSRSSRWCRSGRRRC